MATYGLTAEGFFPKTLEILREEMNEALRAEFGPSLDLSDNSLLGQLVAIVAERYAELWELAEATNASQDPDAATDAALDAILALTGTLRREAAPSTVTLTLTGTDATIVPEGSRGSIPDSDTEFATDEDATIVALDAWTGATGYDVDDRVTNDGKAYVCIDDGTSAGSGGPDTEDDDITDGSVHWRFMGTGEGAVDVAATCTVNGPTVAISGSITEIITPISGWDSVINLLDADVGRDRETDEDARVRRELELARAGTSPLDAIRADLLQLDEVTSVTVFENVTDETDVDGMPPHSVEALVRGGEDQDIFDQLLASVAAGIATYGTETGTAEDSEGTEHTIMFSRPEEIEIYVDYTLIVDPETYPEDGDDLVKAALVAYGDEQATGKDAVASRIAAVAFEVVGVLDVDVDIGTAPSPTLETTIAISKRQLATYDTSRITVATSEGEP